MQPIFDTASGTLVATVLLAHAAWLEPRVLPAAWRMRLPARAAAAGSLTALGRMALAHAGLAESWAELRAWEPACAAPLLAVAEAAEAESLRRVPGDWRVAHLRARLFHAVTRADPGHAADAAHHLEHAR